MLQPNDICAVIDAQGFCLTNKQFIPREIAFVCDQFAVIYEVIPEISDEVRNKFKTEFEFQEFYIHGLPIHQLTDSTTRKTIKQSQLPQLIMELYASVMKSEKSSIAVKNVYLENYLKNLSIPFYNLEIFSVGFELCPTLELFGSYANTFFCSLHCNIRNRPFGRCAFKKASAIWAWLNNKLVSDKMIGSIEFIEAEPPTYHIPLY